MRGSDDVGTRAGIAARLFGCLLAIALAACSAPEPSLSPTEGLLHDPASTNVILLTIDTLRADRLSAYGSTQVSTLHLDRLAREGTLFENASSTVPFTLPAHTSMMTGLYPPAHGVRENVGYSVDERDATLAEMMTATGRETAGFVSAFVLDARWGLGRGFDHYLDDFDLKGMEANLGSVQRLGRETIAAALDWLDGRDDPARPFFLWIHLYDPHEPYEPPEPYRSRHRNRPYDAEVEYTDALVGELRAALEERELFEKSVFAVTGDHGEGLGEHGEMFHGYFVYDTTMRVPLIMRLPNGEGGGRRSSAAVSHVDLAPTLLDLLGARSHDQFQGVSLVPVLAGGSLDAERAVYGESFYPLLHYGWAPVRFLRTEKHKFIESPEPELYEIANDPGERVNRLEDDRPTSRELSGRFEALARDLESSRQAAAETAEMDEETLAQLRALGYVAGRGEAGGEYDPDVERADAKQKVGLHILVMRAQSEIGRKNHEAAERQLRAVLEQDRGILDAHQMLGQLASRAKDHKQAIDHFQHALELDAGHRASLFGLATAYRFSGRTEEALIGYERLLDLGGHDNKASMAMAEIYTEQGDLGSAERILRVLADGDAASAQIDNHLGEVLVLQERPSEARASFESARRKNEKLAQPIFNLAVLHEAENDEETAIALYEQAIERAPRHFQAQFNLALVYGSRGDSKRSQELLEAAIDSKPDFVRGYYFLGKLLMDTGQDLAHAEEITRAGIAHDDDQRGGPLGYFVLADILNRQGKAAKALAAVEEGRRRQ